MASHARLAAAAALVQPQPSTAISAATRAATHARDTPAAAAAAAAGDVLRQRLLGRRSPIDGGANGSGFTRAHHAVGSNPTATTNATQPTRQADVLAELIAPRLARPITPTTNHIASNYLPPNNSNNILHRSTTTQGYHNQNQGHQQQNQNQKQQQQQQQLQQQRFRDPGQFSFAELKRNPLFGWRPSTPQADVNRQTGTNWAQQGSDPKQRFDQSRQVDGEVASTAQLSRLAAFMKRARSEPTIAGNNNARIPKANAQSASSSSIKKETIVEAPKPEVTFSPLQEYSNRWLENAKLIAAKRKSANLPAGASEQVVSERDVTMRSTVDLISKDGKRELNDVTLEVALKYAFENFNSSENDLSIFNARDKLVLRQRREDVRKKEALANQEDVGEASESGRKRKFNKEQVKSEFSEQQQNDDSSKKAKELNVTVDINRRDLVSKVKRAVDSMRKKTKSQRLVIVVSSKKTHKSVEAQEREKRKHASELVQSVLEELELSASVLESATSISYTLKDL